MWGLVKLHIQKSAAIAILLLAALNIVIWISVLEKENQPDLRVSFLNVGQGDSIFIEAKNGTQILIDGGPNSRILSQLAELLPYYDRSIDVVVLTHPHADHVTGLIDVLGRYEVGIVIESGVLYHTSEAKEFARLVEKLTESKSMKRVIIDEPTALSFFDGAELKFIHPDSSYEGKELKNVHDSALVSELQYQNKKFLFMADAGKKLELSILDHKSINDINVLKVSHHGSRYSSTENFLRATEPEYAVISVGRNRYGHPHPDVLSRLATVGAKLFRTDLDGTITFEINRGDLIFRSEE